MTVLIIIGSLFSAFVTVMLYCCILAGKRAEERAEELKKRAVYEKT